MVVDVRKGENGTSSSVMLEEVEFSRALFELYEGGVASNRCTVFDICTDLCPVHAPGSFVHCKSFARPSTFKF